MWPWEHLALGYLLYTGYARMFGKSRPLPSEAYAVLLSTQLPDLVDKPLAWTFDILPSGVSFAHSVFVAVPVAAVAVLIARRYGRGAVGVAFGLGYLSHLLGDLLYPLAVSGSVSLGYLLWPLVERGSGDPSGSLPMVLALLSRFGDFLATPRGVVYLLFELLLLGTAFAVWTADGLPGVPTRAG